VLSDCLAVEFLIFVEIEVRSIMNIYIALILAFSSAAVYGSLSVQSNANDKVLSRKKRYLVFPSGASFSVATCMTIGMYGNPQFSYIRSVQWRSIKFQLVHRFIFIYLAVGV